MNFRQSQQRGPLGSGKWRGGRGFKKGQTRPGEVQERRRPSRKPKTFLKSSVSPTLFIMHHTGSCFDFCGDMLGAPTSSVSSVEATTTKGLIKIHGTDSWTIDPDIFPVGAEPQKKVKFLLRFAVLAPSLYNVQPWLFLVKGPVVSLYANRLRSLVAADPDDRAMMLSCGAVLQYLWLAARHYGYTGVLKFFPDPTNADLVATFALGEHGHVVEPREEELFKAIVHSHTSKNHFNSQQVAPENVGKLVKEVEMAQADVWVEAYGSLKQRKKFARVIEMAMDVQSLDKYYHEEVGPYAHTHLAEKDGVEGFKVSDPGFTSFKAKDGTSASTALEIAEGSPLMMVLGTRSDEPRHVVLCGMTMARVILAATVHGISHSYLNQPMMYSRLRNKIAALVEGVEDVEDPKEQAAQISNVFPQVILRFGYGEPVSRPTPRKSVKEMLIKEVPIFKEHPEP